MHLWPRSVDAGRIVPMCVQISVSAAFQEGLRQNGIVWGQAARIVNVLE